MNTYSFPGLSFFSFLLLFSAFIITTTKAEIVLDSDGDAVMKGNKYMLSPVDGEHEVTGAPFRKSPESEECEIGVIQYKNGWPVTLGGAYVFVSLAYITTQAPVTVSFANVKPNSCSNSSNWAVVRKPLVNGKYMPVILVDVGDDTVGGLFFLETHDLNKHEYKLLYRHHHEDVDGKYIGVEVDKDNINLKRLVLKKEPLVFKFRKADYVKESAESE